MQQNNQGLKYGLIAALVAINITCFAYIINKALLLNMWLGLFLMGLNIVFMILAARATKKQLGGYANFKDLLGPSFLTYFISTAIATLFSGYFMYVVIDPSLIADLEEYTIQSTYEMLQRFGASDSMIEQQIDELKETDLTPTLGKTVLGIMFSSILGFIIAAIIALIMKKNKPLLVEDNQIDQAGNNTNTA